MNSLPKPSKKQWVLIIYRSSEMIQVSKVLTKSFSSVSSESLTFCKIKSAILYRNMWKCAVVVLYSELQSEFVLCFFFGTDYVGTYFLCFFWTLLILVELIISWNHSLCKRQIARWSMLLLSLNSHSETSLSSSLLRKLLLPEKAGA